MTPREHILAAYEAEVETEAYRNHRIHSAVLAACREAVALAIVCATPEEFEELCQSLSPSDP
jgi:hypothetical protein